MLGRLQMTIDESIETFRHYSKMVFETPRTAWRLYGALTGQPKYSEQSLRKAVELVVGKFDPTASEQQWRKDVFVLPGDRCKT